MSTPRLKRRTKTDRHGCILCGRPPAMLGIWKPRPDLIPRLGSSARRLVLTYTLCRTCAARPESIDRVEDRFLAAHAHEFN